MICKKLENKKAEPKDSFRDHIANYFTTISRNQIPIDLLYELIDKITNTQYDNYKRFWNQYQNQRKRYSKLKLEDLEHPFYSLLDNRLFLSIKFRNYRKFSIL
jgi:hypothetical protein